MDADHLLIGPDLKFFWMFLGLGLAGFVGAWFLFRSGTRSGAGRSVIAFMWGVAGTFLFAPSMFLQRTELTATDYTSVKGMWFSKNVETFRYADVQRLDLADAPAMGYSGPTLVVFRKDGKKEYLHLGDTDLDHLSEISAFLRKHGLEVPPSPWRSH